MDGCHLIHLLRFEDGTQWIVRFRLVPATPASAMQLQSEVDTMGLIRSRTKIPVPQVYGSDPYSKTGAGIRFVMLEYISGIVAMDLDGGWTAHHGEIVAHHKPTFYKTMASIQVCYQNQVVIKLITVSAFLFQVEMAAVRMSKIGSILRHNDGTYDAGPIQDLGGPFETSTEFFKAWAIRARFPTPEQDIRKSMGGAPVGKYSRPSQIPGSRQSFSQQSISLRQGPFPIYHPDLYQSNTIVDDEFQVLVLIEWQGAWRVPWELVEIPLFLSTMPQAMDAAFNYDQNGQPNMLM